jgi:hypothetical protein
MDYLLLIQREAEWLTERALGLTLDVRYPKPERSGCATVLRAC